MASSAGSLSLRTQAPPPHHHQAWSLSFRDRAFLPGTAPLAAYLLHLMMLKRSNLCLSADVSTTSELLAYAEEVGESICLLKTHADIINDFSERTVRSLREIAMRKRFLIFEDRKFGDIGSTVQRQYTAGPLSIAKWAEITNAHIFPGPAIVNALKEAANDAISAYNSRVHTEISVGSPTHDSEHHEEDKIRLPPDWTLSNGRRDSQEDMLDEPATDVRKASVVSISTTISTKTEPISPQPTPNLDTDGASGDIFEQLGSTPYQRALLLVAEMSSEGNFLSGAYTRECVSIARQHREFVIGFIAQHSLNSEAGDNFLTMTPGVSFPPKARGVAGLPGDNLGQQYNTPRTVVYERGADIIIVGRGIIKADDPAAEAERYRKEAWAAYQARIGR